MGILDKLKSKIKAQEQESQRSGSSHSGDRIVNKVPRDNIFGDKQAKNEGSGGPPETPREKAQRGAFERNQGGNT